MDRVLRPVPNDDDDKGYITVEQLRVRWNCHPQTVRNHWRKWGLKGTKFGKRLVFTLDSVEAEERRRAGKRKQA